VSNPKWLVIAKNEYRLQTSWIRGLRSLFPSLFSFSLFLVLMPISNTLRDEGMNRVELMLKSPVRPGDVLVGEFLGKTPIYAILATFIIGLFTALLAPLGLSMLQTALIIFMAFVTCLGSFWVGTVIAGVARTTIGRTAKGKDLGKALSFIIALPMVAVFYSMINGNLQTMLLDPGTDGLVKAVLGLFPSSWAAEIIVAFANNPANIAAVWMLTVTRVGGMVVFIGGSLWAGWMVLDRAFSLEPTNLGVSKVGPDGLLYKTVRLLGGGGSFGSLMVSALKDYTRRLENLSQLGYVVGLLILMQAFFIDDWGGGWTMGLLMGTVMALFLSSEATIRGKETLFIYRKTPGGVGRFMRAKLAQSWLLVLPFLTLNMVLTALRFEPGFTAAFFLSTGKVLLMAAANSAMAIGLSLVNPAWVQKSPAYMINMQLIAFLAMGSLIIPDMVFHQEWLQVPMAWGVALVMLYMGYRKLSSME
jgi:hypothetical protein